jgi:hypothetical protein
MTKQRQSRLMQCLTLKESWIIFFILGIVMMNFPFLSIFNKSATIFNIPLLYLYLYCGWFVSIVVILVFTRVTNGQTTNGNNHRNHEDRP